MTNRNRLTDIENTLTVTKGISGWGEMRSFRLADKTTVYKVGNEVSLYSTGNHIQCPIIHHNGEENEKEYICGNVYKYIY